VADATISQQGFPHVACATISTRGFPHGIVVATQVVAGGGRERRGAGRRREGVAGDPPAAMLEGGVGDAATLARASAATPPSSQHMCCIAFSHSMRSGSTAPSPCPAMAADDLAVQHVSLSVFPVHSCAWNDVWVAGGGSVYLHARWNAHSQEHGRAGWGANKAVGAPFSM